MFSHVMVGANDVQASKKFYDAVLAALGHKPGVIDPKGRCFYMTPTGIFAITPPSPAAVNAWHAAGVTNGGTTCEDPPGERAGSGLYLAYLRDPSGNKICALHRLGS
jgi:catechol 2,3-dioxygenase-like lactoylglutathione lyase family enzyme